MARIAVRWHNGATDELAVEGRGPGRTPPEALAMMCQFGATHRSEQIATMLNEPRLWTGKNPRFTTTTRHDPERRWGLT